MKAYGYPQGKPLNEDGLTELEEISLSASPEQLRELSSFLLIAASEMESLGESYDHIHMQDKSDMWKASWPDIVIAKYAE